MTDNHRCTDCKEIYPCTADECDQDYNYQCTPCEIIEEKIKKMPEEVAKKIVFEVRKQEYLTKQYYEHLRDGNPALEVIFRNMVRHSNGIIKIIENVLK